MKTWKGHYINVKKTLEINVRMRHEIPTVWGIDSAVSIIYTRVFELLARGRVQLDSLGGDSLPGSKSIGACFDGIGGCHELRSCLVLPSPRDRQTRTGSGLNTHITVCLGNVSEWIRVLQSLLSR